MKKIFAANWKLFKTPQQSRDFFKTFTHDASSIQNDIIFFPSAPSWEAAGESLKNSKVSWGAQNVYCEGQGAFTGENSAVVLKELGGSYALIGHSERRQIFGEPDTLLAKKMAYVLSLGLTPILCVGETLQERQSGQTDAVTLRQLKDGLASTPVGSKLIIAYEPVWAIGTGQVATPEQAQEAHTQIKKALKELGFSEAPVLYGGSVKPDNAKVLLSRPGIDGFLVGGASLEIKSFLDICRSQG
jgi:triosephosphate isomerase